MAKTRYLRHSLPDYLLCLMMTAGLGIHVFQGFLLPAELSGDVLRLVIMAGVLDGLLFLAAYSRRGILAGVLVGAAALVCATAVLYLLGIPVTESADPEGNAGLWYLLSLVCALVVFLLTRTPLGTGVLFAGGVLCLGLLRLLEYECKLWGLLVFLWGCGVAYLYKRYRKNVLHTSTVKNAFVPMLAWACALVSAAMVAGCGLWWGIVRPLEPPTQDVKLITRIMSVEVLERLGVASTAEILDPEAGSQNTNDSQRLTSQMGEDEQTIPEEQENQQAEGENLAEEGKASNTQTVEDEAIAGAAITYERQMSGARAGALAVGVLALAALMVPFLLRRRIWYRRMAKLPPRERVVRFYHWYLKKFKLLGVPPIAGDTPGEYAKRTLERTRFLSVEGAGWPEVTELFGLVCYGDKEPTQEDLDLLERFYRGFYPNCRRMMGGKYLYLYFLL